MSKFGKYFLLVTGFVLLATFARIPGAIINVHAHDRGCSVASLKGNYAFRRTGVNSVVGGPVAEMGLAFYSGDGTRGLIRTTRSSLMDPTLDRLPRTERKLHGRSGLYGVVLRCGRHTQPTSSSLTEARDSSCSARRRARLSWKRG